MTGNYSATEYRHRNVTVVGINRKKKYLTFFVILLIAGTAGVAYLIHSSGIFAADNPHLAPMLAERINLERQANGLPQVQGDSTLSYQAYTKSQEVRISPMNYADGTNPNPDGSTNIIIIPKLTWALSDKDFQQQIGDSMENKDTSLRKNILNPNFKTIGIGVSSDNYNYFIVTKWKEA